MSDHPPVAGPPAAHSPPPRHRQARWIWYRAGPQTDRAIYSPQNPQHLLKMWCDKSCVGLGVRAAVWFTSSLRWWLLCREHGNSGLPMTGKSHFSKGWVLNTHTHTHPRGEVDDVGGTDDKYQIWRPRTGFVQVLEVLEGLDLMDRKNELFM